MQYNSLAKPHILKSNLKKRILETLNLSTYEDSSSNIKNLKNLSYVICHVSPVICLVSPVTCHLSLDYHSKQHLLLWHSQEVWWCGEGKFGWYIFCYQQKHNSFIWSVLIWAIIGGTSSTRSLHPSPIENHTKGASHGYCDLKTESV